MKNFLLRLTVYAVIILWPLTKIQNVYQTVDHFKTMVFKNLAFYKYKINYDPKNNPYDEPILTFYFFYSLAELIFAILGVFNVKYGHILSIILFIFTNFVYFNPFIPENNFKLIGTKEELFYNIGVLISLGLLTYKPVEKEEKKEKDKNGTKTLSLEDDEMKKSMPVKKSRKK